MCTTMSNMFRSVLTSNYAGVSVIDCYTHAVCNWLLISSIQQSREWFGYTYLVEIMCIKYCLKFSLLAWTCGSWRWQMYVLCGWLIMHLQVCLVIWYLNNMFLFYSLLLYSTLRSNSDVLMLISLIVTSAFSILRSCDGCLNFCLLFMTF